VAEIQPQVIRREGNANIRGHVVVLRCS
jgi:hypothetical protein